MATLAYSRLRTQGVYVDSDADPNVPIPGNSVLITGTLGTLAGDAAFNVYTAGIDKLAAAGRDAEIELNDLTVRITTAEGSISTNTTNISTNAGNISANAGSISTNAGNISTLTSENAAAGVTAAAGAAYDLYATSQTHGTDIGANTTNIAANTGAIDALNTTTVPALDARVSTNETNIAANSTASGNNTIAIATLDTRVGVAELDIAALQSSDTTQNSRLATLETQVADAGVAAAAAELPTPYNLFTTSQAHETNIAANTTAIAALDTRVGANETNIATNAGAISTNETAISTNETAIATNQANITTNSNEILKRAQWAGVWTPQTYDAERIVRAGAFQMISNKSTSDLAEPTRIGEPTFRHPAAPVWQLENYNGGVLAGYRLTNPATLLKIKNLAFWIPDVSPSTLYRGVSLDNVTGQAFFLPQFAGSVLQDPGWYPQSLESAIYLEPGSDVSIFLQAVNESAGSTSDSAAWNLSTAAAVSDPGNTNVIRGSLRNFIAISKTSMAGAQPWLASVGVGSTFTISESVGDRYETFNVVESIDHGTYIEFRTALIARGLDELRDGGNRTCQAEWADPAATEYVQLFDGLVSNPPYGVTAKGQLILGTNKLVENNNDCGVDVEIQAFQKSGDWDIMSAPSETGGSSADLPPQPDVLRNFIDAEHDLGLKRGQPNAAANTSILQAIYSADAIGASETVYVRPGDWWINDTVESHRKDGGVPKIVGAGDCGNGYSEANRAPGDEFPWGAENTRFNWDGPVGTVGKPMFVIRGRGLGFEDIYFNGAPTLTGSNNAHRQRDFRDVGAMCAIYFGDETAGHGTGMNYTDRCGVFGCDTSLIFGSPPTNAKIDGGDFSNSWIVRARHGFWNNGHVQFQNAGGFLPPELAPDTTYRVINAERDRFQISTTEGGAPLSFTAGQAGAINIVRPVQSNCDHFSSTLLVLDRSYTGIRVWNPNSICNSIAHLYSNHLRNVFEMAGGGDFHVTKWDANDLYYTAPGVQVDDWTGVLIPANVVLNQSLYVKCDDLRIDGSIGQVGGDSCLLVDSWNVVNDAGNARSSMPVTFDFEMVEISNEHVKPVDILGRLGGHTHLNLTVRRGLRDNPHFAIRSGQSAVNDENFNEWGPTITLTESGFRTPPTTPQTRDSLIAPAPQSVSGNRCTVIARDNKTTGGELVDDDKGYHTVA